MTQEEFSLRENIWVLSYTLRHTTDGRVHWEIVDELAALRRELKGLKEGTK